MNLGKRILSGIFTIFTISLVVFFMFQIIPGDPVLSQLGADEIDNNPALAEKLREEFNLDKPILERYGLWLKDLSKFKLGNSFKYNKPVEDLIKQRLTATLTLTILAMLVTVLISIPLGLFISKQGQSGKGVIYNILSQLGLAIPSFWFAIVLMLIFSIKLKLLPTRAIIDWKNPVLTIKSLIMPIIVMSIGNISIVIRYLVNAVNEEKSKEYVDLAKSKGLDDDKILKKHVFKNALIPVVSILSMVLINLAMGSIIVENVFNIQGLGSLLITAIRESDYPVSQGIILFYSIIVVVINLIVDIIYQWIDPRIKIS